MILKNIINSSISNCKGKAHLITKDKSKSYKNLNLNKINLRNNLLLVIRHSNKNAISFLNYNHLLTIFNRKIKES